MTANELAAIIGSIDEKYVEEAAAETGGMRRTGSRRRIVLAAVAAAMVTAISATAFAADWFGIRSMLMTPLSEDNVQSEEFMQDEPDTITLTGLYGTDEHNAAVEWHSFLASYDVMGAAMSIGNDVFAPGTAYNFYQVYNQEMADKLDEIAAKYNLRLHTLMIDDLYTDGALTDQVGGDFLGELNDSGSTYMYEDGTFKFDGDFMSERGRLSYQFMRVVKGSLGDLSLNVGDIEQYEEWSYMTDEGVNVTLALGPHRSLVVADFDDCLVTALALAGKDTPPGDIFFDGPLDAEMLETFAESFDFSVLSPAKAADPSLDRPTLEEALSGIQ